MNDERQRIIDRVRKMLAMADDNANANEAATAARMAEALMRKHQIDNADLLASRMADEGVQTWDYGRNTRTMVGWISYLAAGVATANDCDAIGKKRNGRTYIEFTGMAEDIAMAEAMLPYLVSEVDRLAKRQGGGRAELGAFRRGCASTIARRLRELAAERRAQFEETTAGTALVTAKGAAIVAATGRPFQNFSSRRANEREAYAYQAGRRAGNNVSLSPQVGGRRHTTGLLK